MPNRDIVRIGVQKLVERRLNETGTLPCARVQERAYPCATLVGLIARRVELKPVAGVQDDDTVYARRRLDLLVERFDLGMVNAQFLERIERRALYVQADNNAMHC